MNEKKQNKNGRGGRRIRLASALGALGALAVLAACGSTQTRYYTLAETAPAAAQPRATAGTAPFAIEVAPVALPERFARPQLVVRRSGGMLSAPAADAQAEVEILEQSRWSSSFEFELRDTLASSIASRLSALDATKAGHPKGMPVYRISVQLRQFDAQPGTRVDSDFAWSVRRADADALLGCQVQLSEPASGGIDGVALGAQRITARLADEIARSVAGVAAGKPVSCPGASSS